MIRLRLTRVFVSIYYCWFVNGTAIMHIHTHSHQKRSLGKISLVITAHICGEWTEKAFGTIVFFGLRNRCIHSILCWTLIDEMLTTDEMYVKMTISIFANSLLGMRHIIYIDPKTFTNYYILCDALLFYSIFYLLLYYYSLCSVNPHLTILLLVLCLVEMKMFTLQEH